MSRWRPPGQKTQPYISAAGFAALERESRELWTRRSDVVRHLAAAAAEGDRSENAEYIYGKKRLRAIDRRIRFLMKRLDEVEVVEPETRADESRVFFGAYLTVEDEEGEVRNLRIVGPDEIDAGKGWISVDAPMARALMKRAVDDEISVRAGAGEKRYVVIDVAYPAIDGRPGLP